MSTGWNRRLLIACFVVIAVGTIAAIGLAVDIWSDSSRNPGGDDTKLSLCDSSLAHVVYRIDGNAGSASLTYRNATGGTEQHARRAIPSVVLGDCFARNARLYISAQNDTTSGTLTCTIVRDDKVIARSESSGAYTIATCSA